MSDQPPLSRSLPVVDDFDPANQALADALRKSFVLLQWVMALVVILYLSSGLFRVKSGEVGYVLRLGVIVDRDLGPGWHWSLPFPIDEARTMSKAGERNVTVPFMFQLSEQQRLKGVKSGGPTALRPGRDHYLITGDVNILHAELTAQYVITNTEDYLSNNLDVSPDDKKPAEFELLTQILATSATEIAASRSVDGVYKDRDGFQQAVCTRMNDHLAELGKQKTPVGLSIRRVIATAVEGFEPILPPLSVIAEFESVQAAEQKKGQTISEARGKAEELLSRTAGTDHDALAAAVDAEFAVLRESAASPAEMQKNAAKLADLRDATEKLLKQSSGEVRGILKRAEAMRDRLANEAAGDASAVRSLAAEFKQNPGVLKSRMMQNLWQKMLSSPLITRQYVPGSVQQIRLQVPRDPAQQERALKAREALEQMKTQPGGTGQPEFFRKRPGPAQQ